MKTLALSAEGDPLFVRDEQGEHFEVEVRWAGDARFRNWARDPDAEWDEIWARVYQTRLPDECAPSTMQAALATAAHKFLLVDGSSLLVKPATRFLAASLLPSLSERGVHEIRARAANRLGADLPEDEVVSRRQEAHRRIWNQQHPKARPEHSSIYISDYEVLRGESEQGRMCSKSPIRFSNIHAYGNIEADIRAVSAALTLDEVQERRLKTLRRLQDPPEPDPSVARDIRYLMDGLRSRPVL